jgi:hypothetical protein
MGLIAGALVAVLAARFAFEFTTRAGRQPGSEPWAQKRMEFVAWNGEQWTAWVRDNLFEQVPQDEGRWHRHANSSLAFTGWDGEPWQARIEGDQFLLARRGDWNGPIERTAAVRYRDWREKNQLRTVAQLRR